MVRMLNDDTRHHFHPCLVDNLHICIAGSVGGDTGTAVDGEPTKKKSCVGVV